MLFSRTLSRKPETRLFFATDIHGSETCWRKFLNAGKHYEADILILGGDMTGKALVPIVEQGAGRWRASLLENRYEFESEEDVAKFEDMVGKPLSELTRAEASEWIGRLSGRAA